MAIRRSLIPFHFGIPLDIPIPSREDWQVADAPVIAHRLKWVAKAKADLVVSGDCMAAIAAHRNGLPLYWLDAHGDFHDLYTTITGNLGGMPLAMLRGIGDLTFMHICRVNPIRDIVHIGGSEFDLGEIANMDAAGVKVLAFPPENIPSDIHLHIDTDVISARDLPASIHPAPNGIPLTEFWEWMRVLLPSAKVLSIKSHDPRKDSGGQGRAILTELIRRFEDGR